MQGAALPQSRFAAIAAVSMPGKVERKSVFDAFGFIQLLQKYIKLSPPINPPVLSGQNYADLCRHTALLYLFSYFIRISLSVNV